MRPARVPLSLAAILLLIAAATCSHANVLISEMCDPHLNYLTDRFIEVYNAGGAAVDLTDWTLVAVGNGGDVFTWNLSGTIDPGEALVAGDHTTVIPFQVDFPDEAWSNNNSLWNGKVGDGAKLVNASAIVVDYAVVDGTAFENEDYVRNYGVVLPSTTYDPLEWTATPVEYPTDGTPGSHLSAPPTPGPTVSSIVTDPAAPLAGETVDVYADVTDTVAVSSVSLFWGTSQFSLPNEIGMSLSAGDTYVTDSSIPAQSAGTTIYYEIHATNSLPGTTITDIESYSLPFVASVSDIQGVGAASPYDGYAVITHGVVTASYGTYFTIQDGTGARSGLWARALAAPSVGDSVTVRGMVDENDSVVNAGNTLIAGATVESSLPGAVVPAAAAVSTAVSSTEDYEGVLVTVEDAACTNSELGSGEWEVDDGSGAGRVDDLGYVFEPSLGTTYNVTGPVTFTYGTFKLEPRDAADVVWVGDDSAPSLYQVYALSETEVVLTFSEDVDETTAETVGNYSIGGLVVYVAARDAVHFDQVLLTVSAMSPIEYTLVVDGVEDLYSNAMDNVVQTYDYIDITIPAGYYDAAEGLAGDDLRLALHNIIDDHTAQTYTYSWTAFYTTDDKPNGKVWDMYSDVPGGTPPYEYTFGVDQGGIGGVEGTGYNREHAWPSSWSGGELLPKYSDLYTIYPTDNFVNNQRGSEPFGEVPSPTWTSLNGSKRGNCAYPGYSGIAFEPIDEYKGDFARTFFYVTVRYYTEDAAWSTSAMTDGADILPWAVNMLLEWHEEDPVDRKELERNGTVYVIQNNRNPFIDRPGFADLMYQAAGVEDEPETLAFALRQSAPNPASSGASIQFALPVKSDVRIAVYDVAGRVVRVLTDAPWTPGEHEVVWDGLDGSGREVATGVYFYSMRTEQFEDRRKMVLLR
ncbi:MAG: endonuclease [Candidatus Eisenbacteria bacterium]